VQTAARVQQDIREIIFAGINGRQFSASIVAERDGVVADSKPPWLKRESALSYCWPIATK